MAAIDQTMVSNILNATLPTATGGKPTAFTAMATATAMLLRLNSTLSTPSASGTQIPNGGGYTTNGQALAVVTPSSAGSSVSLPSVALSWTNSGSTWSIASLDITDSSLTRSWFGPFTGQPISVVSGNTFQIAISGVTVALS